MPWQNVEVRRDTELDDVFSVSMEWIDATDFAAVSFRYVQERVRNNPAGRNALKSAAESAREADRARRQDVTNTEVLLTTFMNT